MFLVNNTTSYVLNKTFFKTTEAIMCFLTSYWKYSARNVLLTCILYYKIYVILYIKLKIKYNNNIKIIFFLKNFERVSEKK